MWLDEIKGTDEWLLTANLVWKPKDDIYVVKGQDNLNDIQGSSTKNENLDNFFKQKGYRVVEIFIWDVLWISDIYLLDDCSEESKLQIKCSFTRILRIHYQGKVHEISFNHNLLLVAIDNMLTNTTGSQSASPLTILCSQEKNN